MKYFWTLLLSLFLLPTAWAQTTTFRHNGVIDNNHNYHAFTNATIYIDHQTVLENATLLVKDGRVVEVGVKLKLPENTVEHDVTGKVIYPSFIDLYSNYGMPKPKREQRKPGPQMESAKKGPFNWNQAIQPERNAAEQFQVNEKAAMPLRANGFGAVLTHQHDGIMRGTSVLTSLATGREGEVVLKTQAAAQLSFDKGTSTQNYPSSLMGAIALLRQTYFDALWYSSQNVERNLSLEALNRNTELPQIFDTKNYLSALRADHVGDEFGVQYIIKGSGDEYKRMDEMLNAGATYIVPLDFPMAYDVEDAYAAMYVSLEEMKHWELAPANLMLLQRKGIPFCITSAELKDPNQFWSNLRKAVNIGLPKEEALKALTATPAQLLNVQHELGSLRPGYYANFIIASNDLFADGVIQENWVQGKQYIVTPHDILDLRGKYDLLVGEDLYQLKVAGPLKAPKASLIPKEGSGDSTIIKVALKRVGRNIGLSFNPNDQKYQSTIQLSGNINYDSGTWDGNAMLPDGTRTNWNAIRKKKHQDRKQSGSFPVDTLMGPILYPNVAYGFDTLPEQQTILIKNATVWTNEADGILPNTDVLVQNGKIVRIGKRLEVGPLNGLVVIDGTGKHLTCGIVDEHSHIAISNGVNEGTEAISAEVRIGDVINPDDVNIYRQLAGGVTTAQLLHGSANPIGGQSAIIKLRWGQAAEAFKFDTNDGFIKFALGENVKQSNWGDYNTTRYPQTRMGVEQVFYDAFHRARAYEQAWKDYEEKLDKLPKKRKHEAIPPRRDLELETLLEILNHQRFISCHSYVQSEINMLMHVADSMGFTLNTFTHILEGYKVADKMAAHGAGGSTFSDWWAYKYEVNDAIPWNAALMHQHGITVAINSDDAEMARRLNQEAAKAVKYGGVSEEEAWKMVTLNPAKLLHIDDKVGSIKVGKDADLVLWSDNPLSVYATCEMTMVDGRILFDLQTDTAMQQAIAVERARIIHKMLLAKANGAPTQSPKRRHRHLYHCDTMLEDYLLDQMEEH